VEIGGRGVLIEGAAGSGKSSLALALIDRGAVLVGDDGVLLETRAERLYAAPHPNTRGLLEVRNVGLIELACSDAVPIALIIVLDIEAPRFIESAERTERLGVSLPMVRLWPDSPVLALRAELALTRYGLA
jgi:serine kinase of HPr protein (carbohydrate metabolism regulator)